MMKLSIVLLFLVVGAQAEAAVGAQLPKNQLTPPVKPVESMVCNPSTYAYMGGGVCQDLATGKNYLGLAHPTN